MATLTVFKFDTPDGAEKALGLMQSLQKQNLIQLQDAATVSWPQGAKKPKTKQAVNLGAAGALNGAFQGMLFGLIFLVPIFGLAVGALMGGLSGRATDFGIDDNFIKQTREKVTEGTSAVFLLTSNAVVDRVVDEMKAGLPQFELIASNLSKEQEEQLKTVFGEE